jgi:flagellar assembly protein FliH
MHSSYNLIKGYRVLDKDAKKVETEFVIDSEDNSYEESESKGISYEEAQKFIKNYENIGKNIIREAQQKRDSYLFETTAKAELIEREAYEKGYKQGVENGYDDGKREAYDSCIPDATKEAAEIRQKAENLLKSAKESYEVYLENKKQDILELAMTIAENILNREIKDKNGINNLVDAAFELSKGEENIIVKCNPIHEEEIKKEIFVWKARYNIQGEIFVLPDDKILPGNAIIEKNTGKIEVGIEIGLERIRQVLIG